MLRKIYNLAHDNRVLSSFIMQALTSEEITSYGDGCQTRSFCYVDDLIEAMIWAMATPDDFTGPINIGNPAEFTIRQLAEAVISPTGSKNLLISKPLAVDDSKQRQPDISLARKVLDWSPSVELTRGEKTISYFRGTTAKRSRQVVNCHRSSRTTTVRAWR